MGDLFLNALSLLVVPLVVPSLIVGIAGLGDVRKLGRLGLTTFLFYTLTTFFAVALGLVVVNLLKPGVGLTLELAGGPAKALPGSSDIVNTLLPSNLFKALGEGQLLPIILFSLAFGAMVTTIGPKGVVVVDFFQGVFRAVLKLVQGVLWAAPVGVFALVAARLGQAGGGPAFWAELSKIGQYVLTVIVGLTIHGVVVLPLLLWILARRSPRKYALGTAEALTTAFSTASSSATLPLTMENAVQNNGVSQKAALFVLPLGATINMDGTALYEAVAAVFIAQAVGIDLSFGQQLIILLTATLAAVGAAGIPEAGLVTMVLVLKSVGLPLEGIGLLLAVDWFLDRCRTTVNVWGDAIGAAVIDKRVFQ